MKIAILDVCLPDPRFDHHGTSGELIHRWLSPHLPEAEIPIFHVAAGVDMPALEDHDGYVISGSEKGVYDEADWMEPLRAFILAARDASVPVFGVCFGHQIMADVLGGKAEKADKGFVIGARNYETPNGPITAHVLHQDQVTKVPPGAEVIATAPYCPVAALAYDIPAMSVQFHPEFDRDYLNDGLSALDGAVGSAEDFVAGRASMEGAVVRRDLFAPEAAAFFRAHIGGGAAR